MKKILLLFLQLLLVYNSIAQLEIYREKKNTKYLSVYCPFDEKVVNPEKVGVISIDMEDCVLDSLMSFDWSVFINAKEISFSNTKKGYDNYRFPSSIYNIKGVERINYYRLTMNEIPEEIGNVDSLVTLYLDEVDVKSLPQSICKLQKLESIFMSSASLINIPKCLNKCKKLKRITYYCNQELQKLDQSFSVFSTLPYLSHLDVGDPSGYYPFNKYRFNNIKYLSIQYGKIDMKKSFCKPKNLPNLKIVDFTGCVFEKMPIELGAFKTIDTLVMYDATVAEITNDVAKLNNVKVLYINTLKDEELKRIKILLPNCEIITEKPKDNIGW